MNEVLKKIKCLLPFVRYNHLSNIDPPILYTVKDTILSFKSNKAVTEEHLFMVESCLDKMYEYINIGHWKDVDLQYREAITLLSFLKLLVYIDLHKNDEKMDYAKMFSIIDRGLIFGSPIIVNDENILNKFESLLSDSNTSNSALSSMGTKSKVFLNESIKENLGQEIKRISCPSIQSFESDFFSLERPTILTNCISHWPALDLWKDINYINKVAGHRTVPIEIGSKYTNSNWTQSLTTISEFIKTYVYEPDAEKGYLAQYELFEHIPKLKEDFRIPDYCMVRGKDTDDCEPDINAWFGPAGTISPTHYDPKHNLLTQVVGEKLVILFHPDEASNLYCYEDDMLKNTAEVDPLKPDYEKYPDYKYAKPQYAILKPGDMLYIPPKWWHYVKSLSVSFSVSFWWM